MSEPIHLKQKVKEIAEVVADIGTEWDCEFIENMKTWTGGYTPRQEDQINRLYNQACESKL